MLSEFTLKLAAVAIASSWCQPTSFARNDDRITPRLLDPSTKGMLVHGRVEAVEKPTVDLERIPSRVKVTHVYWNDTAAKPVSVTDIYLEAGLSRRFEAQIPFEVGEEGIWLLQQIDNRPLYVHTRIRKKHDACYE